MSVIWRLLGVGQLELQAAKALRLLSTDDPGVRRPRAPRD